MDNQVTNLSKEDMCTSCQALLYGLLDKEKGFFALSTRVPKTWHILKVQMENITMEAF